MTRSALFLLVLAASLTFALGAGARKADRVCAEEPERSTEPEALTEKGLAELGLSEMGLTEEIVPCAVLDSDHFGPHCAAAKVFIHTDTGVLLCSILLPPLEIELAQTPWFDALPDHAALGGGGTVALGVPAAEPALPSPPLERTLSCALEMDPVESEGGVSPDPLPG